MLIRTWPRWLASLCLLASLASCGLLPQREPAPTRTEVVTVPAIAYRPVPGVLTAPIPEPAPPPLACTLAGVAAPCVLDALATIQAWRAALELCNADRRKTALLGASDGQ